jgi:hypothetical protein
MASKSCSKSESLLDDDVERALHRAGSWIVSTLTTTAVMCWLAAMLAVAWRVFTWIGGV